MANSADTNWSKNWRREKFELPALKEHFWRVLQEKMSNLIGIRFELELLERELRAPTPTTVERFDRTLDKLAKLKPDFADLKGRIDNFGDVVGLDVSLAMGYIETIGEATDSVNRAHSETWAAGIESLIRNLQKLETWNRSWNTV